jgi:hypothetical protein
MQMAGSKSQLERKLDFLNLSFDSLPSAGYLPVLSNYRVIHWTDVINPYIRFAVGVWLYFPIVSTDTQKVAPFESSFVVLVAHQQGMIPVDDGLRGSRCDIGLLSLNGTDEASILVLPLHSCRLFDNINLHRDLPLPSDEWLGSGRCRYGSGSRGSSRSGLSGNRLSGNGLSGTTRCSGVRDSNRFTGPVLASLRTSAGKAEQQQEEHRK